MLEIFGLNPGSVKSAVTDDLPPLPYFFGSVSPNAKSRRWGPPFITRFAVKPQAYNKGFCYLGWFTLNPKQRQCIVGSVFFKIRLSRLITSFKRPKTIVIKDVVSVPIQGRREKFRAPGQKIRLGPLVSQIFIILAVLRRSV